MHPQNQPGPDIYAKSLVACSLALVLTLFFCGLLLAAGSAGVWETGTRQAAGEAAHQPLQSYRLDTRYVVAIDAGHGGYDPGAVDATGTVHEAVVNRQMAQRVMKLLAAHSDTLQVVQAYQDDGYSTPMARANTAVHAEADLFVSLHLNGDTSPNVGGFQCFPTPPGRVHWAESVRFARLLVERMAQQGAQVLGTDGIYYTYFVKTPTGYYREILDSAQVSVENPRSDESYGVVEYAGCPAVLVEQWYISSPEDMARFYTSEGMDEMALGIYRAICDYLGLEPLA